MRVGLNLSCGVNETSFTENCYWLDGELLKVDSVRFDFDRDQPLRPGPSVHTMARWSCASRLTACIRSG